MINCSWCELSNCHSDIQVNGKVIISAAGSLQTPPLLLRSGLQHPLVGANLTIHPVLGVGGIYPDKDVSSACFLYDKQFDILTTLM